ncbi:MAG: peptidyl-prolyl cis-trans isomerase [Candidatus Hydrogenedentes bacterium]|nr:peptidyl-prolyl cis-trans isomerase [Candidatus Hydrogenedentota bacterium]
MQDLMRKYRRYILLGVIIIMSVPFIFWVTPGRARRGQEQFGPDADEVVLDIGGVPVYRWQFLRQLDAAVQQQSRGDQRVTYADLEKNGTVQDILERLTQQAILTYFEEQRGYRFTQEYLEQRLRDEFKNEDGEFDAAAYNEWLKDDPTRNWNQLYEDFRGQAARDITMALATAPAARIIDSEIEKRIADNHTKMKVRYVKIAPGVEPTEEDIQQHYTEHQEDYRAPRKMTAAFALVSLQPPLPENAAKILERARAGEDFGVLADEVSDLPPESKNGGQMGWQQPSELELEHRKPLFELPVGQIGDPVYGPGGYFIYKVEEERTNPDTGVREVLGRQIYFQTSLPPEEREVRQAEAQRIADKAKELGSLEAAVQELGLQLSRTGQFTEQDREIEGLSRFDARSFARSIAAQKDDTRFNVITGAMNLYVADVVESIEGEIPPLEEVRDRVREDVVAVLKTKPEYQAKVQEYVDKIKAGAKTLDEIPALCPELNPQIAESQEVAANRGVVEGIPCSQIYEQVGRGEPGVMAGPMVNNLGETYFVDLVARIDPTDEDRSSTEWQDEIKQAREMELQRNERLIVQDYLTDLLERGMQDIPIRRNDALLSQILGHTAEEEEAAPTEAPAEAPVEPPPA